MIGVLMVLLCLGGVVYLMMQMYKSFAWHTQGVGERGARAEYARIQREQPDIAEARLSESEFIQQYVASRPGIARYVVGALLLAIIGLPASCAVGVASSMH